MRTTRPELPPQQARSRDKLARILAAAEELLAQHDFAAVAMTDIARRAEISVGTIYTRFPNKAALLPALFERHNDQVAGRLARLLAVLAAEQGLRARLERLVGFAIDYHRERRGLLRALTTYVRAHPESVLARTFRERQTQYRAVAQVVAGDGSEVADADPLTAVEFHLGVVNSVCREQLLFDDVTALRGRRSVKALRERLVDLVHRGLTAGR